MLGVAGEPNCPPPRVRGGAGGRHRRRRVAKLAEARRCHAGHVEARRVGVAAARRSPSVGAQSSARDRGRPHRRRRLGRSRRGHAHLRRRGGQLVAATTRRSPTTTFLRTRVCSRHPARPVRPRSSSARRPGSTSSPRISTASVAGDAAAITLSAVAAVPQQRLHVLRADVAPGEHRRAHAALRRRPRGRAHRASPGEPHGARADDAAADRASRRRARARLLEHRAHHLRRRDAARLGGAHLARARAAGALHVRVRRQRGAGHHDVQRGRVARAPGHDREAVGCELLILDNDARAGPDRRGGRDLHEAPDHRRAVRVHRHRHARRRSSAGTARTATWATSTTRATSTSSTGART